MFHNYLITTYRNLIHNGMFSLINILGLAIGLMSCILILLFVRDETGYELWLNNSDRMVRLHTAYTSPNSPPFETVSSAGRMMVAIRDYAKNEIETGTRLIHFNTTVHKDSDVFSESINLVDGSFFDVFDLPFVHGNRSTSFVKPYDLVLTEDMAIKYFGKTDVVGESLTLCCTADEADTLSITGVIKNLPDKTHLDLGLIVYLQPTVFADSPNILDTWTSVNVYTYFKMNPGVTPQQLTQRLQFWVNNESPFLDMVKNRFGEMPEDVKVTDFINHRIMPLQDLHLKAREHAGNMGDMTPMGDLKMITTFVIIAILILLIACINFMNLATARASKRAREVAMRKVLGASRAQIAVQFLSEAIGLVFISLLFALVAVEAVLPLYNDALGRQFELKLLEDVRLVGYLFGIALLVGIGAGLYPAFYLSKFMPSKILQGSKGSESGGNSKLRIALVTFQFATSITLVVSTLVVYGQTVFSNSIDVGYQAENKLILSVRGNDINLTGLTRDLSTLPEISSVVLSSEAPTQDHENNTSFTLLDKSNENDSNESFVINYHYMDYGFFEAYKVKLLAGRFFDRKFGSDQIVANTDKDKTGNASVIINQSALKKFGFSSTDEALNKTLEVDAFRAGKQHLKIIGVIPDIYFRSIKFNVRPTAFMLDPNRFRMANLSINTTDVSTLIKKIESVWKNNAPLVPIDLQFLSEMMQAQYAEDLAQAKVFTAFSMLAILVASLGLYGLAAFTAERRTKEIGIRKVMGARVRDIVSLLIWQFSKPVLLANLIAWPVSIYLMLQWLDTFSYRIESFWLFPICLFAGISSLFIAWITVGGNAIKVARSNPIKALRYE